MTELQKKTLDWILQQIDRINKESEEIGEMLLDTEDRELIEVLDERLKGLEKELDHYNKKFLFEKENM